MRMTLISLLFSAILSMAAGAKAQDTTFVSGTIVGETWTKENNPYCVIGDVTVATLDIQSGVEIIFMGPHVFGVAGKLTAKGMEGDSIIFTKAVAATRWKGILFQNSVPGSEMAYCIVEYASNGGIRIENSYPDVNHCTIRNNLSASTGGGMKISNTTSDGLLEISYCDIIDNDISTNYTMPASYGAGVWVRADRGTVRFLGCAIARNEAKGSDQSAFGGGGWIWATGEGSVEFVRCSIRDNLASGVEGIPGGSSAGRGGGLYIQDGEITFLASEVSDNRAYGWAQGGMSGNQGYASGGGAHIQSGRITFLNSIVGDNSASSTHGTKGGGLYTENGEIAIQNCTLARNNVLAIQNNIATVNATNSIFYFNNNNGAQIGGVDAVGVIYSDVQGGYSGTGNTDFNPVFAQDHLQIVLGSPCVDAGDPSAVYNDLCFPPSLGNVRNDMGAHGGPGGCGWLAAVPPPYALRAAAAVDRITLSWNAPTSGEISAYSIFRGTESGVVDSLASVSGAATTYLDEAVVPGTRYYYRVKSMDELGRSSEYSVEACATAADPDPPAAPSGLSLSAGTSSITLRWTSNTECDLAGYNVYRSTAPDPTDSIASVEAGTASYTDGSVAIGETYHYRIRALDNAGNKSEYSLDVSGDLLLSDRGLTMAVDQLNPSVTDTVLFTVTVTNHGPDAATGVVVTDNTPPGLVFVQVVPDVGSYSSGVWTVGGLASGAARSMAIRARVTGAGSITNTARLTAGQPMDPNVTNDVASQSITGRQADLALRKTVDNPTPGIDETVSFRVVARNLGPDAAADVKVIDSVPDGLAFDDIYPAGGTAFSDSTWTIPSIGVGDSLILTITATMKQAMQATNIARIADASLFDPNTANNTAASTVGPLADLVLNAAVAADTVGTGATAIFTVRVTNRGPNQAMGVVVADSVPSGLTLQGVSTTPGTSYEETTGRWTIPSLAKDAAATMMMSVTSSVEGAFTNRARLIAATPNDPVPENNSDESLVRFIALPVIVPGTVPAVTEGTDVLVTATITSSVPIASATLYYRKGSQADFIPLTMSDVGGGGYQATIAGGSVTSEGLECYITATTDHGLTGRSPHWSIQVNAAIAAARTAQPSGSATNAYRLISVPLDLNDKSPQSVLTDDLGAYDPSRWRFFGLRSNQEYIEYPNTSPMNPGLGFLLAVNQSGCVLDAGPGRSISVHQPFAVDLHPAWNFIGNPFTFDIPITSLQLESGYPLDILQYFGEWDPLVASDYIKPFCGYLVWADTLDGGGDRLLIDPCKTTSGVGPLLAGKAPDWSLRITAQAGSALDRDNLVAVSEDATVGRDACDRPEPPVIGDYVSLYFPHPEWGALTERFRSDIRPLLHEGDSWNLAVRSNLDGVITVGFEGLEGVPKEFKVVLIDSALNTWQDLRQRNRYSFTHGGEESPRLLKLIVGNPEFIHEKQENDVLVPAARLTLNSFPNPFRQNTTIQFGLAAPGKVSLRIYNIKGQLVRSLVESEARRGYDTVIWDGRNNAGRRVSSGIYMCRITSGTNTLAQRLVLIR